MVSAIEEIVKSSEDNYVLVCASSNIACDEIAGHLLNVFGKDEFFRMYAKSYNENNVNDQIESCSNFVKGQFRIPCLKYVYTFRIVVCTILTAGCISRARDNDHDFNSAHFSHIFIDECASTNETACLIPIAGN